MHGGAPFLATVIGWQADLGSGRISAGKHLTVPVSSSPMRGGIQTQDFRGGVISSAASTAWVAVVGSLVRDDSAGRAGQVLANGGPGAYGTGLDEAHQGQGQPAEQHVGADALFAAVVDGGRSSRWAVRSRRPRSTCSTCW